MENLPAKGRGWKAIPRGNSSDCIWDFEGLIPCSVLIALHQQGLILPILKFSVKLCPKSIETACREVVAEIQSDLWNRIIETGLLPAATED